MISRLKVTIHILTSKLKLPCKMRIGTVHLILAVLIFLCKPAFSQVTTERFPSGGLAVMTSGFPEIDGYSNSDSDSSFRSGVISYLSDQLSREFENLHVQLDATCEVLIEVEYNRVQKVEVVSTPSTVYGALIQGRLYQLPLEDDYAGHFAIYMSIPRLATCCIDGRLQPKPTGLSSRANSTLESLAIQDGLYSREQLNWLVTMDDLGQPHCFAFSPKADPTWNDFVLKHLLAISSELPAGEAQFILSFRPNVVLPEALPEWKRQISMASEPEGDWKKYLNLWLTAYGEHTFNAGKTDWDTVHMDAMSDLVLPVEIDLNERSILLIADPDSGKIITSLELEDGKVKRICSIEGTLSPTGLETPTMVIFKP